MRIDNKKRNINMNVIFAYIWIFFTIFGNKLFTYVDVSVLMNGVLVLICLKKDRLKLDKSFPYLFIVPIILIIYSLFISIVCNSINWIFILKFIRVALAVVGVSCIIKITQLSRSNMMNILVNVLLIHAIIVIISSLFWIELQDILKPFTGFQLYSNRFRSTGLTNGYDFSGIICIVGFCIIGKCSGITEFRTIKTITFIIAAILTSRVNMLIMIILMCYSLFFEKNRTKKERVVFSIVLLLGSIPILAIVLYSVGMRDNGIVRLLIQNSFFSDIFDKLIYYYAYSEVDNAIVTHFDFSELSTLEFYFGAMKDALQDPGYTQYIFYIGVFGLVVALVFYIIIFSVSNSTIKKQNSEDVNYYKICKIIVLICIICSVKNSYILARHVTEILIIVFALAERKEEKND